MKNDDLLKSYLGEYLEVKRKRFWAKRYAMVDLVKGTLSYKDKRESHANKFVQDLHNSKILLVRKDIKAGVDSHVISIATSAKEEVLYVKFKDGHQFNIWMQHLNAARDVDQQTGKKIPLQEKKKESLGKLFTLKDEDSEISPSKKEQTEKSLNTQNSLFEDLKAAPPTPQSTPKEEESKSTPTQMGTSPTVHEHIPQPIKKLVELEESKSTKKREIKLPVFESKTDISVSSKTIIPDVKVATGLVSTEVTLTKESENKDKSSIIPLEIEEKTIEKERLKSEYLPFDPMGAIDDPYFQILRFEEFESKNWLFNQVISDCRVYSANILLPNDMHNPLTSAPTKERKGAKFLKKLKPYSQLFIDIIILFPILFLLDHFLKTKSGYEYESVCWGILIIFLIFKITCLLLAQNLISKIKAKKKPMRLKQVRQTKEFWIKVEIKIADIPMQEIIEKVANLKHRKSWEKGVEYMKEKKSGDCILSYILDNLTTKDVPLKRMHKTIPRKNEFILLEECDAFLRGFKIKQAVNAINLSMYCCFYENSVELYPTIPIFLDSFTTYLGRIPKKEDPQTLKKAGSGMMRALTKREIAFAEEQVPQKAKKGFDPSNFPYFVTNEVSIHRMNAILLAQTMAVVHKALDIYGNQIKESEYLGSDMKYIKVGRKSVKKFMSFVYQDPWNIIKNKETYSLYTHSEQGKIALKSICTIPFTPLEVLDYIIDLDKKKELYGGYIRRSKIALRLPKNTAILHEEMERQWPVSAQDYSILLHYELNSDGSIHIALASIDHPKVPVNKEYHRGKMEIGGWSLEKGGERETIATYAIKMQNTGGITKNLFVNYLKKNERKTPFNIKMAMKKLYSD